MEKEFLPYELALKLKELGFNEKCFRLWIDKYEKRTHKMYNDHKTNSQTLRGDSCSAPLWQQAFDWLIEKSSENILIIKHKGGYSLVVNDVEKDSLTDYEVVLYLLDFC